MTARGYSIVLNRNVIIKPILLPLEYKINHTVPCCLLSQWETFDFGRYGVHQYDMGRKKINFASSRRKGRFSFAAINNFYVPTIDNRRRLEIEKWFGDMENLLRPAIKKIAQGTEGILVQSRQDASKLMRALFSLRHRTESAVNGNRYYFNENPQVRKLMNVSEERDLNLVVLENMVNATLHDAIDYAHFRIIIFRNNAGDLILGDQPFLGDILKDNIQFIVLSPYFFVAIQKETEGGYFHYVDAPAEIISGINEHIARHARRWIVARKRETLESVLPFADASKQDATPILELPKHLFDNFRFS
jgi:hypothetical protein